MREKKSPVALKESVERFHCPGQSYQITRQMCEARRASGFPKCAKCSRAASRVFGESA